MKGKKESECWIDDEVRVIAINSTLKLTTDNPIYIDIYKNGNLVEKYEIEDFKLKEVKWR